MNIPKKYLDQIAKDIGYCQDCQPIDKEEPEGILWLFGDRIELQDYLYSIDMPQHYNEEIDELSCPNCGAPFYLYIDVGLKSAYEKSYEKRLDKISFQITPKLEDFKRHLQRFPYLGAHHTVGKRFIKDIDEARLSGVITITHPNRI